MTTDRTMDELLREHYHQPPSAIGVGTSYVPSYYPHRDTDYLRFPVPGTPNYFTCPAPAAEASSEQPKTRTFKKMLCLMSAHGIEDSLPHIIPLSEPDDEIVNDDDFISLEDHDVRIYAKLLGILLPINTDWVIANALILSD